VRLLPLLKKTKTPEKIEKAIPEKIENEIPEKIENSTTEKIEIEIAKTLLDVEI